MERRLITLSSALDDHMWKLQFGDSEDWLAYEEKAYAQQMLAVAEMNRNTKFISSADREDNDMSSDEEQPFESDSSDSGDDFGTPDPVFAAQPGDDDMFVDDD
eukprot:m.28752 g.28752  ORF g.28752 m.28752 type:complete len:103 (+) comp10326_c0_seq1:80-388(+)